MIPGEINAMPGPMVPVAVPDRRQPAGQFTSATAQAIYDRLVAAGMADQDAALAIGTSPQAGVGPRSLSGRGARVDLG